ncbi:VlmB-like protein [Streptomyces sp. DH37]|uniref:VlmB-like protein n=1 Tax=Streptomyces sp. DH37 TaxID=3040122 RepID=UPI002442E6DD|nr:VlmB-like protein [Streptomyces sp. DH37]MDG9703208.1 VlmB-like protein [Streptomyces sp. DH37]
MTTEIPVEADWDEAPGLLDGAGSLSLTVDQCDLAYWFSAVAQGTLRDRPLGYDPSVVTPDYMREPGPLREALRLELAYRALDEEAATRVLADYVATAPGIPELEFFSTQLMDEARHHMIFRNHLLNLGVPAEELMPWIRRTGAEYEKQVLTPIKEFARTVTREEGDFIGGVVAFAIIIEGVLAASTELSERKWGVLDPVAGEIARGAAIDEIRHLAVGSSIVREHLLKHPEDRDHVMGILRRGRELWGEINDREFVMHREELFQEGMLQHRELLRDFELFPGCLMLDTTPQSRWDLAARWNDELAESRLAYMGLPEAIDLLRAQAPRIL